MRINNDEKERIDLEVWETEDLNSVESMIHRVSEMPVMFEKMETFKDIFGNARDVLEIGGGHCWASCLVKWRYPRATVTGSDIVPKAFEGTRFYERMLDVKLDRELVCMSYEIGVPDSSLDLVFAFAAAHHFGRHRSTLKELARVLKPGGSALYMHEPACPPVWYPLAHWRVNRHGYGAPEDLLLTGKLALLALEAGLTTKVVLAPTGTNRRLGSGLYYAALRKLPVLQRVMPCSVDIVFTKLK